MKDSITIVKTGFYSTIQDKGRFGYADMGVPESGAMDQMAMQKANALLNNDSNASVLEFTLMGPTILFHCDRHFVITGANIVGKLDDEKVMRGKVFFAKANQKLIISKIVQGCRGYLAIAGGFDTEIVLGSRSMYTPITETQTISNHTKLSVGASQYGEHKGAHIKIRSDFNKKITVYKGPEYNRLTHKQKVFLDDSDFTISRLWNRMGIQLEEKVENVLESISTGPVIPGTVQLTPSGNLVILHRDCQTTGGYPRVLQLSNEGLDKMSQKRQGDQIRLSIL